MDCVVYIEQEESTTKVLRKVLNDAKVDHHLLLFFRLALIQMRAVQDASKCNFRNFTKINPESPILSWQLLQVLGQLPVELFVECWQEYQYYYKRKCELDTHDTRVHSATLPPE